VLIAGSFARNIVRVIVVGYIFAILLEIIACVMCKLLVLFFSEILYFFGVMVV
jgi:hypothetical protein